jgi:hypothetical protein
LDGFSDVLAFDLRGGFPVGDGAGDFQDTVVGAEALLLHGALQHALTVTAQITVGAYLARAHLGIGVVAFAGHGKAIELDFTRARFIDKSGRLNHSKCCRPQHSVSSTTHMMPHKMRSTREKSSLA